MSALKFRHILLALAVLTLFGCQRQKGSQQSAATGEDAAPIVALCKAIDYSDTVILHSDKGIGRHMKDIVRLMERSDSAATAEALGIFFRGLGGDPESLRAASHAAYRMLGNPNSPVRNETLHIRFLESLLASQGLPEDVEAKAADRMRRALLNRPGTRANDFRYVDHNGGEGTLHSFRAPQTMLIFYDPECPHCPEILHKIASDGNVNAAINGGKLKVLAVYTEGRRDVWEKAKSDLPATWTVAYDLSGIVENEIYDIPAMPTVYLLDADKRVLIKDMPW